MLGSAVLQHLGSVACDMLHSAANGSEWLLATRYRAECDQRYYESGLRMATSFSVPTGVDQWIRSTQTGSRGRAILCAHAHRPSLGLTTDGIIKHSRIATHPVLSGLKHVGRDLSEGSALCPGLGQVISQHARRLLDSAMIRGRSVQSVK